MINISERSSYIQLYIVNCVISECVSIRRSPASPGIIINTKKGVYHDQLTLSQRQAIYRSARTTPVTLSEVNINIIIVIFFNIYWCQCFKPSFLTPFYLLCMITWLLLLTISSLSASWCGVVQWSVPVLRSYSGQARFSCDQQCQS